MFYWRFVLFIFLLSLNIFVTRKCSLFQLTVIHPRAEPGHEADPKPALEPVNHAQVHDHKVEFKEAKVRAAGFMDNGLGEGTEAIAKTSASKSFIFLICELILEYYFCELILKYYFCECVRIHSFFPRL